MPFTTTKPVGQFTDINGKPLDGQVFFGHTVLMPNYNYFPGIDIQRLGIVAPTRYAAP